MPQLKMPVPAGAVYRGTAPGQTLVWDGAEWLAQTVPSGTSAFDHVLSSRQDLVDVIAPAGGVFVLPSGSYAVKAAFALSAGERLLVPAGNSVLMMSLGETKVITGAPVAAPLLTVESGAQADLITAYLTCNGANNTGLLSQGTVTCIGGRIQTAGAASPALRVDGGMFDCDATTLISNATGYLHEDGTSRIRGALINGALGVETETGDISLTQCGLAGTTSAALHTTGTDAQTIRLAQCVLTSGPTCVLHEGTLAELSMVDCDIAPADDNADCVEVTGTRSLQVSGGHYHSTAGTPGVGVRVTGNVSRALQIDGLRTTNLAVVVGWAAGVVHQATLQNLQCDDTVGVGVSWPAANIPTQGLVEIANQFDPSGISYNGHNQATARVNRKACIGPAGLESETAIVP